MEVEDGVEFVFNSDGSFVSDMFTECMDGSFSVESNNLTLRYECDGFDSGIENEKDEVTYNITFESDHFVLMPTSVFCIEGCSYRYKKI